VTAILGISAFYHDSAAALVVDGDIVAAAQEERFSRKKQDADFPAAAIASCLQQAGLFAEQLDIIAFYDKPFTKFERLLETWLAYAPVGLRNFAMALPLWLKGKLFVERLIRQALPGATRARVVFLEHHESHAASAFFPSPYQEAAILTLDGVGEWATTTTGIGSANKIRLTHELRFPHSLGLLYSAFTYYCGFKVNSGEYKLMGLAPYGKPIYRDVIYRNLLDLKPDGSFRLNMKYFNYCQGLTMTSARFHRLFGGAPRPPESDLDQRHLDLAASVQTVTEDIILRMARTLHHQTKMNNLVMAGGVALNCVANGRLLREGPFESLWIQPAANDAGGALGAALFAWHQLLEKPRVATGRDAQKGSLLGPACSAEDIANHLTRADLPFQQFHNEAELLEHTAQLLANEKVVGWVHGRMEFGPRALGARSILGDPRSPRMQSIMNVKIKFRESFRPFAPVVLKEHAAEWFDLNPDQESPYMLLVAPLLPRHRTRISLSDRKRMFHDPDLCHRVNVVRSSIPAVTHIDYSARVQTVDAERNPRFHGLLQAFHRLTGCPVLVNTSFNVRGEPIVCTAQDALACFLATDMDALVLENVVIHKNQLQTEMDESSRRNYLAQFQLD
jgi:carbamoyltransferase